jgi:hypothetical protein
MSKNHETAAKVEELFQANGYSKQPRQPDEMGTSHHWVKGPTHFRKWMDPMAGTYYYIQVIPGKLGADCPHLLPHQVLNRFAKGKL